MEKAVRLDKYLADAGCGTRSEVKKWIRQGRVLVDGKADVTPELKIIPGVSSVVLNGEEVCPPEKFVYYILNKPAGYITATEDTREKTVMDLLPPSKRSLFPVGRLDKDTVGLLLITDDGQLAHDLLSPKKHVSKTYYVRYSGVLSEESLFLLEKGLDIGDDKPTAPAKAVPAGENALYLTITEGRFHQVKRMLGAVGCEVTYLKRISMGNLTLPEDLPEGSYRKIFEKPLKSLFTP